MVHSYCRQLPHAVSSVQIKGQAVGWLTDDKHKERTIVKAYDVIFRSGAARTLYGKTKDDALASIWNGAEVDCVIDVIENLERGQVFNQQNASLLKNAAIAQGKQEIGIQSELRKYAQTAPSGLALPQ